MNCFNSIHQVYYYFDHNSNDEKEFTGTKVQRSETFSNKDHVEELFKFLDKLTELNAKDVYKDLFFVVEGNQYVHDGIKVRLFDGNEELNLLTRCAKGENYTILNQILLFGLLKYVKEFGTEVTDQMKVFIRLLRNELEGETFSHNSDQNMTNTLKISQMSKFKNTINDLLERCKNSSLVTLGREYAEINDFDFANGNLNMRFLLGKDDDSAHFDLKDVRDTMKAWDSLDEYNKIALLVAYGYEGRSYISCGHGSTYL